MSYANNSLKWEPTDYFCFFITVFKWFVHLKCKYSFYDERMDNQNVFSAGTWLANSCRIYVNQRWALTFSKVKIKSKNNLFLTFKLN